MTAALSTRKPWMLVTSKAVFLENSLAVSTWILNSIDVRLNATRSINLSVYLVFDLEANDSSFCVEICLALGGRK